MNAPASVADLPAAKRAPLIDWLRGRGPAGSPPSAVADHLVTVLRAAARRGRRQGLVLAVVLCWLPALAVVVATLLVPGLR